MLTARGWPEIPLDGRLLVTQQDALLLGGKVQAMPGFADHVLFKDPALCRTCGEKTCVAMCSGQAITQGEDGLPAFEREKCIHCGACLWNCGTSPDGEHSQHRLPSRFGRPALGGKLRAFADCGGSSAGVALNQQDGTSPMNEIIFDVREDEADGGYVASALGYGIHTQGETLEELRAMVKDAVNCYFDESMQPPAIIRLHFVRDEVLA